MPKKKTVKTLSPKKQKKSSNKNFFFIVAVVLLSLAVILFFLHSYQIKKEIQSNPSAFEKSTLSGLSDYLNANAVPREYIYDDWILPSGERIPLTGQELILGTNGTNGVGKYGNFTTDQLEQIDNTFINTLQTKISSYFLSKGFSKNIKNTNLKQESYYTSTYAYEKDEVYCLSHAAKQSDPFGYITCGTVDHKQMKLQEELSDVNETEQAANKTPITFRVDKVQGDFASGSVSSEGGYQWIAKNNQGKWEKIWSGQDFPLCLDMAKYEVPKEFYPGCYNPETEKEQRTY